MRHLDIYLPAEGVVLDGKQLGLAEKLWLGINCHPDIHLQMAEPLVLVEVLEALDDGGHGGLEELACAWLGQVHVGLERSLSGVNDRFQQHNNCRVVHKISFCEIHLKHYIF